ncbi:hypothetical protein Amet_1727 [Alkaliphilus metalliredigens QYMF]|uniref:Uncharacterized protein n=1 Tax=Alkaliphilus metalliredigens (strain QYMF) TaxID=293826 RepID=A6TNY5_ALKMQ|nr:hypothetical protein [Alkaliphilus metalliredigens]ABR47903.1 hypothetical protein Amet_1727 [Alkaliphilus metalliredigens QYMF]
MNRDENSSLDFALLSWTRAQRDLQQNPKHQAQYQQNLEKIESHLAKHNISHIAIAHQSEDYYTLRYIKDGRPGIKQFTTDAVEKFI